ncbi:MAG TPA: hypothetical protein VFM55_18260 [Micromonosporaceae bacterium]|nr:hypothetical protein [Micromonosporaceae bacterium]
MSEATIAPARQRRRGVRRAVALGLAAIAGLVTFNVAAATPATACCTPPEHAIIVCQSASFYADYIHGQGPVGFKYTMYYGDKVGHTRGSHPVYNGWAATYDFGKTGWPSNWGYVRYECLGGWGSW